MGHREGSPKPGRCLRPGGGALVGGEQGGVSEDMWGPGARRVVRWGQGGLGSKGLVSAVHAAVWAFGVSASSAWGPQRPHSAGGRGGLQPQRRARGRGLRGRCVQRHPQACVGASGCPTPAPDLCPHVEAPGHCVRPVTKGQRLELRPPHCPPAAAPPRPPRPVPQLGSPGPRSRGQTPPPGEGDGEPPLPASARRGSAGFQKNRLYWGAVHMQEIAALAHL